VRSAYARGASLIATVVLSPLAAALWVAVFVAGSSVPAAVVATLLACAAGSVTAHLYIQRDTLRMVEANNQHVLEVVTDRIDEAIASATDAAATTQMLDEHLKKRFG